LYIGQIAIISYIFVMFIEFVWTNMLQSIIIRQQNLFKTAYPIHVSFENSGTCKYNIKEAMDFPKFAFSCEWNVKSNQIQK
jgi:hypothetical protein